MGVPAFFRWLSRKYKTLVVHCVEEKPRVVDGVTIPLDTSKTNPNDVEFDNLYLDMNGIIHPCCHPENKPAPKNENEMMVDIFAYIDRIFAIVRPRKLLYMAVDGVAPRAKMNQQRSRRFRATKESIEKMEDMARIKAEIRAKGGIVPPDKPDVEHFDSNCITPGTPFMFRLADCLRFYIHERLNSDPGWQGIKVILSDANVPGEGEHKIMDYIRKQRAQPDHDPNTHHCLCGADADLIMLGLATHEPHFTIIREEFKPNQPRPCDICGQLGHEMKECTGAPKEKTGEHDELGVSAGSEVEFIFIRLAVLREFLENELKMEGLPFKQDIERAIDDWVFMCFFVGNDFLPHLPPLEIREGAIDRLVKLYKKAVYKTGGYLTHNGQVNLSRVQLVMSDLGEMEDEIFKDRRSRDLHFKQRDKAQRKRAKMMAKSSAPAFITGGQYKPQAPGAGASTILNPRQTAAQMRTQAANFSTNQANSDATAALKSMISNGSEGEGVKRKSEDMDEDDEPEPVDDVKLWEDGWKDRYYQSKFGIELDDEEFRRTVANEYVLGLCWVLGYYYQGCPSWKWYFPYHYAPFASDFINIGDLKVDFGKHVEPFKPLEQLMGVFPAGSKQHLPLTWQDLMDQPDSPIIDLYPEDFEIDLNGKKYAWQGVALLPFVDETRLLSALESVYPDLTPEERTRNVRGNDRLFVGKKHESHAFLEALYEDGGTKEPVLIDTKLTQGMKGDVWCDDKAVLTGQTLVSMLPQLEDVPNNSAICVSYRDPVYEEDFIYPAIVLPGAKFPPKTVKPGDWNQRNQGQRYRPQLGFKPDSGYRGRGSFNSKPASRMIRGGMSGGQYSHVPPPLLSSDRSNDRGRRDRPDSRWSDNRGSGNRSGGGGGYQGQQQSSWQRAPQADSWGQGGRQGQQRSDSYSTSGRRGGGGGGYTESYSTGQGYQGNTQSTGGGAASYGGAAAYGTGSGYGTGGSYGTSQSGYGTSQSGYGTSQSGYGTSQSGYGASGGAYAGATGSYGQGATQGSYQSSTYPANSYQGNSYQGSSNQGSSYQGGSYQSSGGSRDRNQRDRTY